MTEIYRSSTDPQGWRFKFSEDTRYELHTEEPIPFYRCFFPLVGDSQGQAYCGITCRIGGVPMALPTGMRRACVAGVLRFNEAFVNANPNFKWLLVDRSEGGTPTRMMGQIMTNSAGELAISINDNIEPDNATMHNPLDLRTLAGQWLFIQADGDLDAGRMVLSIHTRDRSMEGWVLEVDPIDNPVGHWAGVNMFGAFVNALSGGIFYDIAEPGIMVGDSEMLPPSWFYLDEQQPPAPDPEPVPEPTPEPVPPVVTNHNELDDALQSALNGLGIPVDLIGGRFTVTHNEGEAIVEMTPIVVSLA